MTRAFPAVLVPLFLVGGPLPAAIGGTPALPPGEGRAIVQRACARCHALRIVSTADHSSDDWRIVVRSMMHQGARLTPAEVPVVVRYLSRNFPKSTAGSVAPDAEPAVESAVAPVVPRPRGLPAGY